MKILLVVISGILYCVVTYWCLSTRLRYRKTAAISLFSVVTFSGLALALVVFPDNPGMVFVIAISSGVSARFGVQMTAARLPPSED